MYALLAWYDEQPELLSGCVASLAGVADRLIAVDGAFERFPDGLSRSNLEQAEAVVGEAGAAGVACTLHRPTQLWPSEVAKRAFMFDLARAVAGPGGWFLVIDADERVVAHDARLSAELSWTTWLVAEVQFETVRDLRYRERLRRLYRNVGGLTVVGSHGNYRAGELRLAAGTDMDGREAEPALDASAWLTLEHAQGVRSLRRDEQRHAYSAIRPQIEV